MSRMYRDHLDVDGEAFEDWNEPQADYPYQSSAWLGAIIVMLAFVLGGLSYACAEMYFTK